MSKFNILLYNKVELDDGSQGIVRYMGNIMGKKGTFYGVDITKGDAKNEGKFKNIKYFDTKKGTRTGRFCKASKITKCKKTTFSKYPFKLGETVLCTKPKCKGTVKYVGVPSWVKGGKVYYGLELTKKKGTCNGTNQGVQYFEAKMQYGIYVPSKNVKKVGKKKKKSEIAADTDDVKDAMRDYYNNKPKEEMPASLKKKKSKKKVKSKKKTKKKVENTEKETLLTADIEPMDPTVSVDYMDEEKDGIDVEAYKDKTDEMDYERSERQRREQNELMKQMEREERQKRDQQKKEQILREKREKEKRKQELIDQKNAEREQELLKKEKELRDKERLQKYAQARQEKEANEKAEKEEREERERKQRENEARKQQELEDKKAKEEQERLDRENERKLAEKLRNEREAKANAEKEQKQSKSPISAGNGGSLKDRMAMFQKKTDNNSYKKPVTPVKAVKSEPETKENITPKPVSNGKSSVGAPVGADKAINFEVQNALGKALKSVKMTKVSDYSGEIPLALYLLGEKLTKLDKFGTFKIFHPEEMQKQANKPEMAYANNIYVFFASLPEPLLHTVGQQTLMKAINKDVMSDVCSEIDEPYSSTLIYLWDILAKVAMNPNARMGGQSLGKVFGPMCTMVTQADVKGNRVSMNALGASRMMSFFRRGIEWRMGVQGYDWEESDSD